MSLKLHKQSVMFTNTDQYIRSELGSKAMELLYTVIMVLLSQETHVEAATLSLSRRLILRLLSLSVSPCLSVCVQDTPIESVLSGEETHISLSVCVPGAGSV